ncbi:hypothetical protein NQ317_005990 [Molorchus minor]|uniref:Uncharacterized protein n=1 Tax=Molorchus minor TaxID=1323400 RepID=A0ABQ9J9X8_9CUCU|nr:hypothetical protein NQ317_005990 [Molorchus minor]
MATGDSDMYTWVGQNALDVTTNKDLSKASTTDKPTQAAFSSSTTAKAVPKPKPASRQNVPAKSKTLVCPSEKTRRPFFLLRCRRNEDCSFMGRGILCCDNRCLNGVKPAIPETKHAPTFFGFVERICPINPLPELWEVKECISDDDCSPRICCPETLRSGENVSYCRTAQPLWDRVPAVRQFVQPLQNIVSYMQCTPPPPPYLDLFPKSCENALDCFPNLCCQEGGKKYCRPPRRSFLSLIAALSQVRLIPNQAARRFLQRITPLKREYFILGHDKLNLPIPTSVRGITFFPEDEHLSGCATKEGHVLLYDDRAQRRPVVKFLEPKASYTAIACAHRERQCLVGTTRGYMQLLDMKAGKCLKTFTSFLGSVTDIVCDPTEPYVATTSLDRFFEGLHEAKFNKILMRPVIKEELLDKEIEMKEKEIVDEEYEDIFNGMDTVTSDKKLKKQKRKS